MTEFTKHGGEHAEEGSAPSGARRPYDDTTPTTDDAPPRETAGDPVSAPGRAERPEPAAATSAEPTALFPEQETEGFRTRWMQIQTDFVDEPRRSVEQADALVGDVTERLTSVFTRNRDELERQWAAGDEVSTEDLRQTLQRYRSFFERLLSV